MAENKTKPTTVRVDDFLASVSNQRQKEALVVMTILQKISGQKAVMWGSSIIGFGSQHYKSEAGREGTIPVLGFSPRKASLTLYFYEGFDRYGAELERLGKHKTSKGCLYIARLADVNMDILTAMLQKSYALTMAEAKVDISVETYVAHVPAAARSVFDELRTLVKQEFPDGNEVISYGVLGYKRDIMKRGLVFISGWKDHVAIYPIPKDEALREELQPYIKGKGTLWFRFDEPLPRLLIKKTIKALIAR